VAATRVGLRWNAGIRRRGRSHGRYEITPAAASEPAQAVAPTRKRRNNVRKGRRTTAQGDVPPTLTARGIEDFSVAEAVDAAVESKSYAVQDILSRAAHGDPRGLIESFDAILAGAAPDDIVALRNLLSQREDSARKVRIDQADGELADDWRDGGYPYKHLMSRRSYERKKYELQVNCSSCRPGSRTQASAW